MNADPCPSAARPKRATLPSNRAGAHPENADPDSSAVQQRALQPRPRLHTRQSGPGRHPPPSHQPHESATFRTDVVQARLGSGALVPAGQGTQPQRCEPPRPVPTPETAFPATPLANHSLVASEPRLIRARVSARNHHGWHTARASSSRPGSCPRQIALAKDQRWRGGWPAPPHTVRPGAGMMFSRT